MSDTAEQGEEQAEQGDQGAEPTADEERVLALRKRRLSANRNAERALARLGFLGTLRERLDFVQEAAELYDLDETSDMYGGGIVETLEKRVAELLGKEAAAFFPTGTMAQQVALRCWAGRTGNPTVALHPLAHPEVHERDAISQVSGLRPVHVTSEPRQPTADEIRDFPEPFGTLMLELPLRDAGLVLPSWEELSAVVEAARERDAVVHFDGARLWESTPHFGRPLDEIADLADSVYVSFYKSLEGLGGAALVGPKTLIDEAKTWRHRYGGMVFQQFPTALTALAGLDRELPGSPSTWPTRVWSPRRCARGSRRPGCPGHASTPSSRTRTSSRSGCRTTSAPSRRPRSARQRRRRPPSSPIPGTRRVRAWRSPRSTSAPPPWSGRPTT